MHQAAFLIENYPEGHPLKTFNEENLQLARLLDRALELLDHSEELIDLLTHIRELRIHYAKKGDLLYPILETKYGITGPSRVMWTVDQEIRDELAELVKQAQPSSPVWTERVHAVLKRAKEMIFKEQNILLPLCADQLSEDDWLQIYHDAKDYKSCLGVERATWLAAEEHDNAKKNRALEKPYSLKGEAPNDARVILGGGEMSIEQLEAVLNTIPLELTFVDDQNINRYFNENSSPKLFKRPQAALGRDVASCHPPKAQAIMKAIIEYLRSGAGDVRQIWGIKEDRHVLISYYAVRSKDGRYLGVLEAVQDMEDIRKHFLEDGEAPAMDFSAMK